MQYQFVKITLKKLICLTLSQLFQCKFTLKGRDTSVQFGLQFVLWHKLRNFSEINSGIVE